MDPKLSDSRLNKMTVYGLVTYNRGHFSLKTTPRQFQQYVKIPELTLLADSSLDFFSFRVCNQSTRLPSCIPVLLSLS